MDRSQRWRATVQHDVGDPRAWAALVIDVAGLQALMDGLLRRGYTVVGPTVQGGAVVHAPVTSVDELPRGIGDTQDAGSYRLRDRGDGAFFGFTAAADSWKGFLFPARRLLWRSEGADPPEAVDEPPPAYAFLGVRSCDLHAIEIQDRVFGERAVVDPDYAARRQRSFVVAVTCTTPGGTCFCVSMGTGPRPDLGFDVALTELLDGHGHRFLAEPGSAAGAELLAEVPSRPASATEESAAAAVADDAAGRMGRTLDTTGIRELLYANAEHPRWDDAASRCLSCTNCTLVCPTCFCATVEDTTDLLGATVERAAVWDSCFTADHSALHGTPVRASTRGRYRQWLTHKLASWIDQFGTSGCVGCGRCITWCPVGIDITEEVAAIRDTPPPADQER
jgi:sulfhydrogenase subunit beta (sulfur reductase)